MMRLLLAAVQFLTLLPVRASTAMPGDAAIFFPLVGAWLGIIAGSVVEIVRPWLGSGLAAAFGLLALTVATGGLHEDGLADVADALRAGRTREKMFAILKDSRVGSYGALAVSLAVVLRWQAIGTIALPMTITAAVALSRATMVAVAAWSKPAGDGLGAAFVSAVNPGIAVACVVQAVVIAALVAWQWAGWLAIASAIVIPLAILYFKRRLGGVTGDCLGAACIVSESVYLVILACPLST